MAHVSRLNANHPLTYRWRSSRYAILTDGATATKEQCKSSHEQSLAKDYGIALNKQLKNLINLDTHEALNTLHSIGLSPQPGFCSLSLSDGQHSTIVHNVQPTLEHSTAHTCFPIVSPTPSLLCTAPFNLRRFSGVRGRGGREGADAALLVIYEADICISSAERVQGLAGRWATAALREWRHSPLLCCSDAEPSYGKLELYSLLDDHLPCFLRQHRMGEELQ
eukprot:6179424-Pleurochrysis_carterae.AAC.3